MTAEITFTATDSTVLHGQYWLPTESPKAVVVIAHGMAEHISRYASLATELTAFGWAVYGIDQRGHGKTAGSVAALGYVAKTDGLYLLAEDMHTVIKEVRALHPDVPIVLLGHSMGTIVSRLVAIKYSKELAAVVLSGPAVDAGLLGAIGKTVAQVEAALRGPKAQSPIMNSLSFGKFNNGFENTTTDFDWLSRDPQAVAAYTADPYCGTVFTASFFRDMLIALQDVSKPAHLTEIRSDLPVYVLAGDEDPVGGNGDGVQAMVEGFAEAGLEHVHLALYPGARHECFNETNREEVISDLCFWLQDTLPG